MRSTAAAPGSCGELVQGWEDGRLLQITCPVDRSTRAEVRLRPGRGGVRAPAGFEKARSAVATTLERLDATGWAADLRLESPLPRSKGMGSSTADVVAAGAAAAAAAGHEPDPDFLADVAVSIEPSDGTMLPGIALFDHRNGRTREPLGAAPPLRILVIDPGGTVDTVAFNGPSRRIQLRRRPSTRALVGWRKAFRLVREGIRSGDMEALGRGATESALAHQELLASLLFPAIVRLAREAGALGVNRAHSGTVAGLLFAPGTGSPEEAMDRIRKASLPVESVRACRLVGGGARLLSCEEELS